VTGNNKPAASSESEEPAVASNGVHNAMYSTEVVRSCWIQQCNHSF